jgi:hypothetical protein
LTLDTKYSPGAVPHIHGIAGAHAFRQVKRGKVIDEDMNLALRNRPSLAYQIETIASHEKIPSCGSEFRASFAAKVRSGLARKCGKAAKNIVRICHAIIWKMAGLRQMDPEDQKNLIVLGAVVGLIALCLFVLHLYSRNAALERCVEEGRRDCLQIPGQNN